MLIYVMCQIHLCQLSVKTRMSVIGFSYWSAKIWLHEAEGLHLGPVNRRHCWSWGHSREGGLWWNNETKGWPSSRAWPQLETNEWASRGVCRLKENLKWMNNLFLFLSSSSVQRYGAWYLFENKENINKETHCQPLLLLDRVANNSTIFG